MKTYDLVVIGSGTAAQVASARVRKAGSDSCRRGSSSFGGTCALRGCDPKKMLLSGAEAIDAAPPHAGSRGSGANFGSIGPSSSPSNAPYGPGAPKAGGPLCCAWH